MKTRRLNAQLQLSIALSLLMAVTPYTLKVSHCVLELQSVLAKDGNNGNGNGNGGGNGGGNGNGNSGGNSNGNQGGKSEARGNSSSAKDSATTGKSSAAGLSVRHDDGITEFVRNGRYIMKDSKGRTIVNRQATLGDEIRLRFFRR